MFEEKLKNLLAKAVTEAFGVSEAIVLEIPRHSGFGDFACPVAMKIAKQRQQNPREIAQKIIAQLPDASLVEKAEVAGPGFINLTIAPRAVAREIASFNPRNPLDQAHPQRIVVEFSSPNVAKPLHIGHFRNTMLGESLSRILIQSGNIVHRDNFLGNWGTQFGKLVVAVRRWGNQQAIEQDPIEELLRLYQRFHEEVEHDPEIEKAGAEEFHKLEQRGDRDNYELWEWIVNLSIQALEQIYERLGVHFDTYRGEQFYEKMLPDVLHELEQSGVGKREEGGALIVEFAEETNLPTMIFQKTDGATLYQTRDLARIKFYQNEGFDRLITITGSEQTLHFRQVYQTARLLHYKGDYNHLPYGLISLPDGKMSSRKGKIIRLTDLLDEAVVRARQALRDYDNKFPEAEQEELAEIIGLGSITFNSLCQNKSTDITFDWKTMLSFEGYSAPFLQYSAVRCFSILRKADNQRFGEQLESDKPGEGLSLADIASERTEAVNSDQYSNLELTSSYQELSPESIEFSSEAEIALAKKLLGFSAAIRTSAEKLEPHHLSQYLFELASEFNRFYTACPVLTALDNTRITRLMLTEKTGQTLRHGLYLLGIRTPSRM